MLLEREDGSEIKPGQDIRPQGVTLPKLGKRQSVFSYYNALSVEQALALAVVSKVLGTMPEAVIRTRLAKQGMTVFPNGDAPTAKAPTTEADLMAGIPFDTKPVELAPMPSYSMAAPEPSTELSDEIMRVSRMARER